MMANEPLPALSLPRVSRTATRLHETTSGWSLFLSTGTLAALLALAMLGPWMTDETNGVSGAARPVGYAVLTILTIIAARPWRHPQRLLVVPLPIIAALLWCWLSLLWAVEPVAGLRRIMLTTAVAWNLFALVRQLGPERSITVLRVVLAVTLIANFAVVLIDPVTGIHPEQMTEYGLVGKWRGLMDHKNFAGLTCALTILLFSFDAAKIPIAVRALVVAGAAIFMWKTDSASSLGMCIAAVLFGFMFLLLARRYGARQLLHPAWAFVVLGLTAVLFISIAFNPSYYLDLLNNNPGGFTGRTQIWGTLIRAYVDRPLFGIGFGSFWGLGPDGPVTRYTRDWVAEVTQGHNGYLDLLVQIGAIGTLIVVYATLVWPIQRLLRGGTHPTRTLGAAILLFCIGHNFTEATLFDRDMLGQVFIIIAIALLWSVTAGQASTPRPAAPVPRAEPDTTRGRAPLRLDPEG